MFSRKFYKLFKNSWTKEIAFAYIRGFIFYGVSRAKTDLHIKYIYKLNVWFNFVFGWF